MLKSNLNYNIKGFFITFLSIITLFIIIIIGIANFNPKSKYLDITNDKNILILKYQLDKLDKQGLNKVDTIYLGDSSLGDTNFEEEGYFLTSDKFFSIIKIANVSKWIFFNVKYLFKFYQNIGNINNNYYNIYLSKDIVDDYSRQITRDEKKFLKSSNIKKYLLNKKKIFNEIYEYSASNNLNLILINGPIDNKIYKKNINKIKKFDEYFIDFNDIYLDKRIILEKFEVGDFPMHVQNDHKNEITNKFLKILLPKLILLNE